MPDNEQSLDLKKPAARNIMQRHILIAALVSITIFAVPSLATAQSPKVDYDLETTQAPKVDYELTRPNTQDSDVGNTPNTAAKVDSQATRQAATPRLQVKDTTAKPGTLRLATWGGAYAKLRERTLAKPYTEQNGVPVEITIHPDAGHQTALLLENAMKVDVVELGSAALHEACANGRLKKRDALLLGPSSRDASLESDFVEGGLHDCGTATFAWSTVILANPKKFKKKKRPATLADVFNVKRFPGKRAFFSQPRTVLELALLADGVPHADIYALLATEDGLQRAFAKLDTLGDNIVWVGKSKDALERLLNGEFAFAQNYSGRAFMSIARGAPIDVIWDGQVYDVNYLAIPANAPSPAESKKLIAYATSPERLAAQARELPYGPMRHSAVKLTDTHARLGMKLAPHLPTSEQNLRTALPLDTRFWTENESTIAEKFASWIVESSTPGDGDQAEIVTGTTANGKRKPGAN